MIRQAARAGILLSISLIFGLWTSLPVMAVTDSVTEPAGSYHYYYFDEPIALGLDCGRIAVYDLPGHRQADSAAQADRLAIFDITAGAVSYTHLRAHET